MDNFELACVALGLFMVAPELCKIVRLWCEEKEV